MVSPIPNPGSWDACHSAVALSLLIVPAGDNRNYRSPLKTFKKRCPPRWSQALLFEKGQRVFRRPVHLLCSVSFDGREIYCQLVSKRPLNTDVSLFQQRPKVHFIAANELFHSFLI